MLLGDEGAQAARMVDVAVCVDDVFDRLVGNELFRFGDNREAPRLALPRFDDRDAIHSANLLRPSEYRSVANDGQGRATISSF